MDLEDLTAPMTPIPPWQSLTIAWDYAQDPAQHADNAHHQQPPIVTNRRHALLLLDTGDQQEDHSRLQEIDHLLADHGRLQSQPRHPACENAALSDLKLGDFTHLFDLRGARGCK